VRSGSNMWWIGPIILIVLRLLSAEARLARAQMKKVH
jgi:hypothetical protein